MSLPTVPYETYRNIASDGAKGMLELGFGDKLQHHDFGALRQQFLDYYQQNICVDTAYFDGIESLLTALNDKSIPWGIVTNKPEDLTMQLVKYFPLLDNCHVIIGGDSLAQRKPHPLPLLHAQKALPIEPKNTWYIGDALRDIEAANAANMVSVLAEYGYIHNLEETLDWDADVHIGIPTDLLDYLA